MAHLVELATIGTEERANEVAPGVQVKHTNLSTITHFRCYWRSISESVYVVLLVLDSDTSILPSILSEMNGRKHQVIGVFIHGETSNAPTGMAVTVYYAPELLITYKINATIARFLELEYSKQLDIGHRAFGISLEERRKQFFRNFSLNVKYKACHILLIPLNATPKDLHNAAQHVKNICYSLYGNEYQFIIRTLFDYIPEDERDINEPLFKAYLEKHYRGDICRSIMDLAMIRMYVVGNQDRIENGYSEELVASEPDVGPAPSTKYLDECVFVIDQPVRDEFRGDLSRRFCSTWQRRNAVPETLVDIQNDIHFQSILQTIYGCLENREMVVNERMRQRFSIDSSDTTGFSSDAQLINQAQNGPEEKHESGCVNNQILGFDIA